MSTVIINDIACEGEIGERLIDVARRNALHTGFLCDGKGLCQTCICQVQRGEEQLSPMTYEETTFMRQTWRDTGHRMACQASIRGSGTIEILTRAEQMRREAIAIISPPEGTTSKENINTLVGHVGRVFANQLLLFPGNAVASVKLVFQKPVDIKAIPKWATDVFRVSRRMVTGSDGSENNRQATKIEVEMDDDDY